MRRVLLVLCFCWCNPQVTTPQSWFQTGQPADLMISGVDFNNTGGPLQFNHPSGIDSDGRRFLLCDRFNNRILIWNSLPTRWDNPPDLVLGQKDFNTNAPGRGKDGLNFPGNVSIGPNGIVTVCDTENDRILIWLHFPTQNGQPADVELHLPDFAAPGAPMRYEWPWGVWTDGTRLVASATQGGALLFWNSIPTVDNQPPDFVLQQPEFGTPRTIASDGQTFFMVGDHNPVIEGQPRHAGTFVWHRFPSGPDDRFDFFIRHVGWIKGTLLPTGEFVAGGLSEITIWDGVPASAETAPRLVLQPPCYANGDGPDVVYAAGRLYVNNYNGNNVLVYESLPTRPDEQPDWALGSPDPCFNTLEAIGYIQNPVIATDGHSLFVTSDFDRALYVWKHLPERSGQKYDLKIDLLRNGDVAPWDNALWGKQFVAGGQNKVAVWDQLPVNGEPPSRVLQGRIGSVELREVRGVALDSLYFYLAGPDYIAVWEGIPASGSEEPFSVLRFRDPGLNSLHSDGVYLTTVQRQPVPQVLIFRVADIGAGEVIDPEPYKRISSRPDLSLNLPSSAITFDGAVAIANTVFNQVLLWRRIEDAGDPTKVVVLGQSSLEETEPGIGRDRLFWPASLCAYGNTLWVGEFKFSSRILRFSYEAPSGLRSRRSNNVPHRAILVDNYPNPFNAATWIRYVVPRTSHGRLRVYDARGKIVRTLLNGILSAGEERICFEAGDLPSGVYIIELRIGEQLARRKMVLVK